jgi:ribonuclease HI
VKHPEIRVYVDEIKALLQGFSGKIIYTHIPREMNSEADRLANKAMDEGMS